MCARRRFDRGGRFRARERERERRKRDESARVRERKIESAKETSSDTRKRKQQNLVCNRTSSRIMYRYIKETQTLCCYSLSLPVYVRTTRDDVERRDTSTRCSETSHFPHDDDARDDDHHPNHRATTFLRDDDDLLCVFFLCSSTSSLSSVQHEQQRRRLKKWIRVVVVVVVSPGKGGGEEETRVVNQRLEPRDRFGVRETLARIERSDSWCETRERARDSDVSDSG